MVYKYNSNSIFDFSCNVFLITRNNESILIDAGLFSNGLKEKLQETSLKAILLTHGHFDHIQSADKILSIYDVPLFCGEEEDFLLNSKKNGSFSFKKNISITKKFVPLNEGNLTIGNFNIKCFYTPGHSEGSFIFYFEDEHAIFFGDTVLGDSFGRFDLYSGSYSKLKNSLSQIKYMPFKDDDICYFGHGDTMTYKELKQINPYI